MKNITILGSTGKIGTQTLEVIRNYPSDFKVIGLACGHHSKIFDQQIKEFKPKIAVTAEQDGEAGLIRAATQPDVDLVVVAVVGLAGLAPTLASIRAKKQIALATKEVLVIAGDLVIKEAKKYGAKIIPLDSEHSAIFQCLKAGRTGEIKNIYLTMGKGPIAKMTKKQLTKVTIKEILKRPAWSMGVKIAVDSATSMNKAFEVIEAAKLFNLKQAQIKIIVHPEYLCHSLVEFIDGSFITELGVPDMKRYLQYALFYPKRLANKIIPKLDLIGKKISFSKAPVLKFPCLKFGHLVLEKGGTMPAVLHGADRAAVRAFLNKKIKFTDIPTMIMQTIKQHKTIKNPNLQQLIKAEEWGDKTADRLIKGGSN